MFCKNCGTEIRESQKFCPKCGAKNFSKDSIESYENVNENINAHGSNIKLFIIIISLLLVIVIITIAIFHFGSNNVWNDYLQTHQVDENAKDITYYVTDIGGDASDFSYDLSTDRIISSQVYDIDNDGVEELLQISIRKDKDNIQIYPCLEVVKESNGTYSTELYDFSNAKYYVSTLFEGDYYLYKSEKNTYVLVEKDAPGESWQFCAAGVISCDKNNFASYSFTQYDNGDSECYDNFKDERIISTNDTNSTYYVTQMSNLRTLFSSLGLKGFLTGTDDIDNIMNYNDITLIGKFTVTINGSQGHIAYSDLISDNAIPNTSYNDNTLNITGTYENLENPDVDGYIFYSNGKYDNFKASLKFSGNYELTGNTLTLKNAETNNNAKFKIFLKNDILQMEDEEGNLIQYKKVDKLNQKTIDDFID